MNRTWTSALTVVAFAGLAGACAAPSANTTAGNGMAAPAQMYPITASPVAATPAAPQWVVSCEPHQQAQIRQILQNGTPVNEVTCIDRAGRAMYPPSTPRPAYVSMDDDYVTLDDRVAVAPRAVRTQPAVYTVQEPSRSVRPVQKDRSWKKSAVIIGSSAGVGAGVGAAVGGKKGALIGAAIGGGGAAIWDQATRRR
jgi:hypothetical protein